MPATFQQIDTTTVEIDGIARDRGFIEYTFDNINETISITYTGNPLITNMGYADISADGGGPFASYTDMTAYVLLHVAPLISVQAISVFSVGINSQQYDRKDLNITLDDDNEELTVEYSSTDIIDKEPAQRIYVVGETEPFASYAALSAWVLANMQNNAVIILPTGINTVDIDEAEFLKNELKVFFSDEDERLFIIDLPNDTLLCDAFYSDVVNGMGGEPFTSYAAMKSWIQANVLFYGQLIEAMPGKGYYLINGKPFAKGLLFFAWNDAAETVEIRYSHYDLKDKPMPPTAYDMIFEPGQTSPFASYQALIDFIAENTFVHQPEE